MFVRLYVHMYVIYLSIERKSVTFPADPFNLDHNLGGGITYRSKLIHTLRLTALILLCVMNHNNLCVPENEPYVGKTEFEIKGLIAKHGGFARFFWTHASRM